ncbi:MAG: lysophospholipid acyltransferase family protein [Chloroflexota bacterium]
MAQAQNSTTTTKPADLGSRIVALANQMNLTYWLIIVGGRLARAMPTNVSYRLASFIGDLVFFLWREKRRAAIDNMCRVLGPTATKTSAWWTARQSYRNYLQYTVDFLRFPFLTNQEIKDSVDVSGVEHLDEALAAGKGVIFVGVHFGNFDWGAAVMAVSGYPVHAVVDTFEPPKLNTLIQRYRTEKGLKVIQMENAGRAVLRVLRQKHILGLLVDKPVPGQGVRVNFCGGTIEVPAGAATLSLKTGAPIVGGHIVRQANGRYRAFVYPPLSIEPTGDLRRDVVELTQRMMNTLGELIAQYPEHWYMFRRMWAPDKPQPTTTSA